MSTPQISTGSGQVLGEAEENGSSVPGTDAPNPATLPGMAAEASSARPSNPNERNDNDNANTSTPAHLVAAAGDPEARAPNQEGAMDDNNGVPDYQGIWFTGPHGTCDLAGKHRHETNGAIYFPTLHDVAMNLEPGFSLKSQTDAMKRLEAIRSAQGANAEPHGLGCPTQ